MPRYIETMNTLLVVNASGRVTRSITGRLTDRFARNWSAVHPAGTVLQRDVGIQPPTPVNEAWIAAAFAAPNRRTPEMHAALVESDTLLEEIERADAIAIGAPLYNFGMPAQLKAWFDQIIRVGRTFDFTAWLRGQQAASETIANHYNEDDGTAVLMDLVVGKEAKPYGVSSCRFRGSGFIQAHGVESAVEILGKLANHA